MCLDDLPDLKAAQPGATEIHYTQCEKVGMYRHSFALETFHDFLDNYDEYMNDLTPDSSNPVPELNMDPFINLNPLVWSDELAYSAAKFMGELDGCSVYPNQLWRDGDEHEFLHEIAHFKNH